MILNDFFCYGNNFRMKREYSQLYTEFAPSDQGGTVTRSVSRAGGKITMTEKTSGTERAFDLILKESLFFNGELQEEAVAAVADVLKRLLKDAGYTLGKRVLVVGLGNEGMIADSLGAEIVKRLNVTGHLEKRDRGRKGILCALKSSVSGVTGLPSFEVVKGVAERIKPDVVIAADTLACTAPDRLGKVIQFTDGGISPGSGVGNAKTKLDRASLGCPVIALGVPLVIYLRSILKKLLSDDKNLHLAEGFRSELSDMVVTMKEIDVLVDDFARVIAEGINRAVHVSLPFGIQ